MSVPRQQHYRVAHKVLPERILRTPLETFDALSKRPDRWCAEAWDEAGADLSGGDRHIAIGIRVEKVPRDTLRGHELVLIHLPRPENPTEAYAVLALWHLGVEESVRCFVMERGVDGDMGKERAYWSEYRANGMRVRGADLPTTDPQELVKAALGEVEPAKPAANVPITPGGEAAGAAAGSTGGARGGSGAQDPRAAASARMARKLRPRDDIPGFVDKGLLYRLVRDNGSFLTLAFWPMALALGGVGVLTMFGVSEALPRFKACMKADSKYESAHALCMERSSWRWKRSYGTEQTKQRRKQRAEARCQERTAGKTAQQYCLSRMSGWKSWGSGAAAALGAALFFGLLWMWGRSKTASFVKVLRDRPGDVVWIYGQQFRNQYGANRGTYVNLGLRNGSTVMISISTGQTEMVILNIAMLAPQATLGYSREKAKSFGRKPSSLARG